MAASDPLAVTAEEAAAMAPGELEQVLAAWVKAGRAELPLALAAQAAGPQTKLAKKALYQLRSRGVPVEAPAGPTAPAPAAAAAAAEAELPGALSALLGTGERAVVFARPVRGGGLTVYQGVYSDEEGLLQLVATPSTRGEYRRRLAELRADPQVRTLEVSWARVRLELGQALWLADRAATPPPAQVMDLVRPLQLDPVDPAATPLPEPEEGDDRLAARAASLRQERELATWLPSEPALAELGRALDAVEGSPLALSPAQRGQRGRETIAQVAATYLTPARRRIYARRLWATAELFAASHRTGAAEVARAEARRLFHLAGPSAFVEALFLAAADARPDRAPEPGPAQPPAPPPGPSLILP